jgi:hypothetical protein
VTGSSDGWVSGGAVVSVVESPGADVSSGDVAATVVSDVELLHADNTIARTVIRTVNLLHLLVIS